MVTSTASHGAGSPPRLADIDLLVLDFDGVLTDNRVYVASDGAEMVACTRADGWGLDLLRATPLEIAIVSTETNPVVSARARKLRLPVVQGVGDKAEAVRMLAAERHVPLARVAFVGNDSNDLPALSICGWPICPSDAHASVRAIARWIAPCRGGEGVIRHLADVLLDDEAAPSASGRYQVLARRTILEAKPYVTVTRERLRLPDGSEIPDYYLIGQPDYAVVAALARDGRFVMLREYKHGAGRVVLACPGGNVDDGEDARAAAERELLEETGYGGGQWTLLGRFVCHGSQNSGTAHFFLARAVERMQAPVGGDPDRDAVELLAPESVWKALQAGEIGVLGHATAVALAFSMLGQSGFGEKERS